MALRLIVDPRDRVKGGGPIRPRCDLAMLGAASVAVLKGLATALPDIAALHAHAVQLGMPLSMMNRYGIGKRWATITAGLCRGNGHHSGCTFPICWTIMVTCVRLRARGQGRRTKEPLRQMAAATNGA